MLPVSRICRVLAIAVVALCASLANADTALTPHKAEYKVKISIVAGLLNTELSTTANGYVATHSVRATGMARMFSKGEIRETASFDRVTSGIRPEQFESNDTLTPKKVRASIQFDWDAGSADVKLNDEDLQFTMDDLVYDRVSIQYELMSDLMNGSPSAQYVLFDIDEFKTIDVRKIGTRTVSVPAGEFEAIGLEHQAVGSKRITTMWCVQELDYLPVIIEQHRKGDLKMRAVLNSYDPVNSSVAVKSGI